MNRVPRYRSPELDARRDVLKRLVSDFIVQAANNPDYNTVNVVHDCVVYVMQNKPPELGRVDGALVQPVVQAVVLEMIQQRSGTPSTAASSLATVQPARPLWLKRALAAAVSVVRQFVN